MNPGTRTHVYSYTLSIISAYSCLVKDFEKRPTSLEMLHHEFVRFVPRDPKVVCPWILCNNTVRLLYHLNDLFQFRRKLTVLIDMYQHSEPRDIFSDSSSSVSGADTIK